MRAATIQHEPGWHEIGMTSIGNKANMELLIRAGQGMVEGMEAVPE